MPRIYSLRRREKKTLITGRQLHFETLEDRRVLATFVVTNTDDMPVAAANDAPGTLRQAIFDANDWSGVDTIEFNLTFPATIVLDEGQLDVTESVHINGPGAELLTIDASGNDTTPTDNEGNGSRIFEFDGPIVIDATISGLTLKGGDEIGDGGAISVAGALTISDCVLTDNAATSGGAIFVSPSSTLNVVRTLIDTNYAFADGGGIVAVYSTTTTISDSEISRNRAGNETYSGGELGGGIAVFSEELNSPSNLIIKRTLIDGNAAPHGGGGGIFYFNVGSGQGVLEIRESRITNNLADDGTIWAVVGPPDPVISIGGGGVYADSDGSVLISHSTIDNNQAFGRGGGLDLNNTATMIINTTISSNEAMEGGGVWASNAIIKHSTITLNRAGIRPAVMLTEPSTSGGGGLHIGQFGAGGTAGTVLNHTIVAGNFHELDEGNQWLQGWSYYDYPVPDIGFFYAALPPQDPVILQASYTIVGTTAGPLSQPQNGGIIILSGTGNQTNVDPLLAALADNGGPTPTHALVVGSPAVDAGDPDFVSPPVTDQRTPPFLRVVDGNGDMVARIDIGAFELQPIPGPFLLGDYNHNGVVDAADYTVWRDTLGQSATPFSGADGDGSGVIDPPDYDVWKANFGNTLPPGSAAIASASIELPKALSTAGSEPSAMASSIEQPVAAAPRELKHRGMTNIARYFSGAATSEILELALIDSNSNPQVTKLAEDLRTAIVQHEQVEAAAVESIDEFFAELENDDWQHIIAAIG